MRDFIKVMKALFEPNRVRILKILQWGPLCVCKIWSALGIAQPTVSSHLRFLEEAGLVAYRKEGLWVHYRLGDGGSLAYAASLLGHLRHWLENSPEIVQVARALSKSMIMVVVTFAGSKHIGKENLYGDQSARPWMPQVSAN